MQQTKAQDVNTPRLTLIKNEPVFLHTEGRISNILQKRFASLFCSVWERIPQKDKNWILAKARRHLDGLRVILTRIPHETSNGWASDYNGLIGLDAWFVDAATDRLAKTLIAHELGHIRGYADPEWPSDSEAVACLYAERLWRFPGGDPVFKSAICLQLDDVIREVGLKSKVFQYRTVCDGEPEDTFLLLPPGQKLDFNSELQLDRIGGGEDDFETIADGIRRDMV
jgi:hypothetical protein